VSKVECGTGSMKPERSWRRMNMPILTNCEKQDERGLGIRNVKYWEIIADKIAASGWTWGYCRAITPQGWRYIVDAHYGDGRRFIVESDELLTAVLELEVTLL
jgi:hypothetical protein